MKMLRTTFLVCSLLALEQILQAAILPGYVIEWGLNTSAGESAPSELVLSNATAISAGRFCCLALQGDGTVTQWGVNLRGEADFGNTMLTTGEAGYTDKNGDHITNPNITTIVTNGIIKINGRILNDVISIAAGDNFGLGLKKNGTVVAWGQQARIEDIPELDPDNYPDLNSDLITKFDPFTGLPLPSEQAEKKHIIRIGTLSDGTVATRFEDQTPVPLSNIVAIATGYSYNWALKNTGTVVGWSGEASNPDCGRLLTLENLSNVVAIAVGPSGYTRGVALKKDGTVGKWGGESTYKEATPPAGLNNVVAIAAGGSHSLALKSDGKIIGWGFNGVGQAVGIPTTNSPPISAGQVALGGEILSNVVSIAANEGYSMALKKDGTVTTWGRMLNNQYPALVPAGLSNVVAITAGEYFCVAITTNAAVAKKFRQK